MILQAKPLSVVTGRALVRVLFEHCQVGVQADPDRRIERNLQDNQKAFSLVDSVVDACCSTSGATGFKVVSTQMMSVMQWYNLHTRLQWKTGTKHHWLHGPC